MPSLVTKEYVDAYRLQKRLDLHCHKEYTKRCNLQSCREKRDLGSNQYRGIIWPGVGRQLIRWLGVEPRANYCYVDRDLREMGIARSLDKNLKNRRIRKW